MRWLYEPADVECLWLKLCGELNLCAYKAVSMLEQGDEERGIAMDEEQHQRRAQQRFTWFPQLLGAA